MRERVQTAHAWSTPRTHLHPPFEPVPSLPLGLQFSKQVSVQCSSAVLDGAELALPILLLLLHRGQLVGKYRRHPLLIAQLLHGLREPVLPLASLLLSLYLLALHLLRDPVQLVYGSRLGGEPSDQIGVDPLAVCAFLRQLVGDVVEGGFDVLDLGRDE